MLYTILPLIGASFATFVLWIWLVSLNCRRRLASKGIPLLKQSFKDVVGIETMLVKESPGQIYLKLYGELGGRRWGGMTFVGYPILVIGDPGLVHKILVQDFDSFTDRGIPMDVESDPLEGHLFNLPGAPWRALRYKMSPAFTGSKLKWMSGLISDCADKLMDRLEESVTQEKTLEMTNWMSKFTTDVIGSTAFGVEVGTLDGKGAEFQAMIRQALKISAYGMLVVIVRILMPSFAKLLKLRSIPKKVNDFFFSLTSQVLKHREETGEKRSDFVQLLLQLKQKGSMDFDPREKDDEEDYDNGVEQKDVIKIEFTEGVLAAQSFVFFVAGYETTASTLGFTLYLLSKHPDVQEKLRREIVRVKKERGDEGWSEYDTVKDMVYLDSCISEALRLYPPLPFLNRICTKTLTMEDGTVIESGTAIIIPVWGIQTDPRHFPDPQEFRPERFLDPDDPSKPRRPADGTYLPFGEGPRMCIGKRFALLEAKLALMKLVEKFSIAPSPKTDDPPVIMPSKVITQVENGFWFQMTKLQQ